MKDFYRFNVKLACRFLPIALFFIILGGCGETDEPILPDDNDTIVPDTTINVPDTIATDIVDSIVNNEVVRTFEEGRNLTVRARYTGHNKVDAISTNYIVKITERNDSDIMLTLTTRPSDISNMPGLGNLSPVSRIPVMSGDTATSISAPVQLIDENGKQTFNLELSNKIQKMILKGEITSDGVSENLDLTLVPSLNAPYRYWMINVYGRFMLYTNEAVSDEKDLKGLYEAMLASDVIETNSGKRSIASLFKSNYLTFSTNGFIFIEPEHRIVPIIPISDKRIKVFLNEELICSASNTFFDLQDSNTSSQLADYLQSLRSAIIPYVRKGLIFNLNLQAATYQGDTNYAYISIDEPLLMYETNKLTYDFLASTNSKLDALTKNILQRGVCHLSYKSLASILQYDLKNAIDNKSFYHKFTLESDLNLNVYD